MPPIYLDNNATTKPAPEVVAAMLPYLTEWYGNPSSVHRFGQRSRQAIDEARSKIAGLVDCSDSDLVFTGGGTESINTAIRGLLAARSPRKRIISSTVEHSATRELCAQLAKEGAEIIEIDVESTGALDLDRLAAELTEETALLTLLWANNETGVLFPIEKIVPLCNSKRIPFHCDGTQAVGKIPVNVNQLGLDTMSFASHKFHGPKGVASLFVRKGLRIRPLIIGGPQERNRRGGTENVPGIVGMGAAAQLAQNWLNSTQQPPSGAMPSPAPRSAASPENIPAGMGMSCGVASPDQVIHMRNRLEHSILRIIPHTSINGRTDARLANTTNIAFSQLEAEAILLLLSEQNICASAGAACSSGSLEPSHVLKAMKIDPKIAHGAIRFSLSRYTTDAEIDQTLEVLPAVIKRLRAVLPVG